MAKISRILLWLAILRTVVKTVIIIVVEIINDVKITIVHHFGGVSPKQLWAAFSFLQQSGNKLKRAKSIAALTESDI